MKKIIKSKNNFVLGITMIAVGLFLVLNDSLSGKSVSGLGGFWAQPDTYIKMLGCGLILFSTLLVITSINFKGDNNVEKISFPVTREAIITAAALVAYCYVMPIITFFPATFILVFGLNRLYRKKEAEAIHLNADAQDGVPEEKKEREKLTGKALAKSLIVSGIYSLCITATMWLIFTRILKAVLP